MSILTFFFDACASVSAAPYNEATLIDSIVNSAKQINLRSRQDSYGNLWIRIKRGQPNKQIVFLSSLDSPCLRVVSVRDGSILCTGEGPLPWKHLPHHRVFFPQCNHPKAWATVVEIKEERKERPYVRTLRLIPDDANVVPNKNYFAVLDHREPSSHNSLYTAAQLHPRVGCAAILRLFEQAQNTTESIDIVGVFYRVGCLLHQGLVGILGENVLTRSSNIVCIESAPTNSSLNLHDGPVIRVADNKSTFDPKITASLQAASRILKQQEPAYRQQYWKGGISAAHVPTCFGYNAASIGIPIQNLHHYNAKGIASETCDLYDIEQTAMLLLEYIKRTSQNIDDMELLRNTFLANAHHAQLLLRSPIDPHTQFPTITYL